MFGLTKRVVLKDLMDDFVKEKDVEKKIREQVKNTISPYAGSLVSAQQWDQYQMLQAQLQAVQQPIGPL